MANLRNQLDDEGTLRIHSKEGAYVEWEFLLEDGTPDPNPPNNIKLYIDGTPEFSTTLGVGALPHIYVMSVTKAQAQNIRNGVTVDGKPRSVRWAVVDESVGVEQVLWEGLVEWEGW